MKRKKITDDEILKEIYRRVYAVSEPPADFDHLMATAEINSYGQKDIKFNDKFWLKDQPYSVQDMLDSHLLSNLFIGGKVYHAF